MKRNLPEVRYNKSLREYCRNATNIDGDTFVGIKLKVHDDDLEISVNFPIGYAISEDDESVRDEIIDLIGVLSSYDDKKSKIPANTPSQTLSTTSFPVQAYFNVMHYYLSYGYYKENEESYVRGFSGPFSMKQTIRKIQPIVQKNGFIYPSLMVRKKNDTDKNIITEINKFCVYESFMKLGWIYQRRLPSEVTIKNANLTMYKKILRKNIESTHKDNLKQLFQGMLAIIEYKDSEKNREEFYFGTQSFEYIWEKLIDCTYGIRNKKKYFPRTSWRLSDNERKNAALEPDTIMIAEDEIVVLDAKYYKYGITKRFKDLPNSTSINKQITYAEYIAENHQFTEMQIGERTVQNAFLMPFNKEKNDFGTDTNYYSIGEATADWKSAAKDYERVQGILVDVKGLISNSSKPNYREIKKLSKAIKESLKASENYK